MSESRVILGHLARSADSQDFLGYNGVKVVRNFWYLFVAYTIIWTALFAYVVYLSKINKELRNELRELQRQVARLLAKKEVP